MEIKQKKALKFIFLGMAITVVGALFKIMHWPYATILLILGLLLEAVGLIMLITKAMNKLKDKK